MVEKKEVVQCVTEEQWIFVNSKLPEALRLPANGYWHSYGELTCKNIYYSTYGELDFYEREDYKIYSFEEWCELTNNYSEKNKIKDMEDTMLDVLTKTYDNPVLRKKTVPLFMSNPGMGKTSIIKKFVKDKGVNMVKITLSQRMPNEVVGMVMPDVATGKLVVYDSHELSGLKDGDVLFFDEVFNGTLKQTLDAVLNLLEDRMLPSGKKLADVMIVAASNPQGLINLTPQIKERFVRYDLKFSRSEYQKLLKERYGMPESISGKLCTLIGKEKFEHDVWNYTTPRSVEKAINQIGCDLSSPYDDVLIPYLSEELEMPLTITADSITKGEKVQYLKLLKLIVQSQNDTKDNKQKDRATSNILD